MNESCGAQLRDFPGSFHRKGGWNLMNIRRIYLLLTIYPSCFERLPGIVPPPERKLKTGSNVRVRGTWEQLG